MSTSIDPYEIQPHRTPLEFGGTQKGGAMYSLNTELLENYGLVAKKDVDTHVSITTQEGIPHSELGERLAKTQSHWMEIKPYK